MTAATQQTSQRLCRFPACQRPAVLSESGTGRPPEYCADPGHNRAAAWRARQQLSEASGEATENEALPVDAARQRASAIRGQVVGMIEHLEQQLQALVNELRTVGDPDAAEAQIEAMASEAAEQVAAANGRATRAEQAQHRAEAERAEADAAAIEATQGQERLKAELAQTRTQLHDANEARDLSAKELAESQSTIAQLRQELDDTRTRLGHVEKERDIARVQAETASEARTEADERANAEAARAARAEDVSAALREQLDNARDQLDKLREQAGVLRSDLAAVTAERDLARKETERERVHGDQRVADLQSSYDRQFHQLRQATAATSEQHREAEEGGTHARSTSRGTGRAKPVRP